MSRIHTDQKLQLVRAIRMENQYNRMKCREREQLLYGRSPEADKRELYGAETAISLQAAGENVLPVKKSGVFSGFRLRFLLAVVLFSVFIYLDKNELSVLGKNTFDLFVSLTESIDLSVDLPFLNSIDF